MYVAVRRVTLELCTACCVPAETVPDLQWQLVCRATLAVTDREMPGLLDEWGVPSGRKMATMTPAYIDRLE